MKQSTVVLSPGEYFVGGAAYRVKTLLGSCVSITLWHRAQRVGAMSHFLLAERPVDASRRSRQPDARYGTEALALMLDGLAARGIAPDGCEAKVFGGGNMFPQHVRDAGRFPHVGQRNGDAAIAMLAELGVEVVSSALYGVGHRVILFDIATGFVWARHQPPDDDNGFAHSSLTLPGDLQ